MKGVSSYSLPSKRGWRGLAVAVFGLVILSMLVPLVFLLGLHNGFHSTGYPTEDRTSTPVGNQNGFKSYDLAENNGSQNQSEVDKSAHIDNLMRKLGPTLQKDAIENAVKDTSNKTIGRNAVQATVEPKKDTPVLQVAPPKQLPDKKSEKVNGTVQITESIKDNVDETGKPCQLEFGSYCLWREEHKEDMKDKIVKKMKDQLFVARAYYPSIAKLPAQDKLSREMKQNIQEFERILSESTTDADLPPHMTKRLQKMEATIVKAKSFVADCSNVDKKLRQILDLTEDESHFHMKQSAFLYQLAVQTMPKSIHCLSMRLTVEYFRSPSLDMELVPSKRLVNTALYHYVIFSNNILASSVVINSTVTHAKESGNQVFHVVTDGQNYYAMKLWFFRNSYKEATIHVVKIEDINLDYHDTQNPLHLSLSNEFRVSFRNVDKSSATQMSTEYISVFGNTHFLLPEIFPDLKKVVVLDDDIVVKQDLSSLWSLNMEGKVNGAVQFCAVKLGQLKSYLGEDGFNQDSCSWMSGLNIIDLAEWKKQNLTATYRRLLQVRQRTSETSASIEALPASLLTFQNLVYALDSSWVLSGLGHDYGVDDQAIKKAAVLHYNGKMKPWLELGIPRYKSYWKKFLTREDHFMSECNVNP